MKNLRSVEILANYITPLFVSEFSGTRGYRFPKLNHIYKKPALRQVNDAVEGCQTVIDHFVPRPVTLPRPLTSRLNI